MRQTTALELMKTGKNIFLTGGAGTGKTFILNKYIDYLRSNGVKTAITASTGIAASHIGGITIHSWSGLGIKTDADDWYIESLLEKKYLYKRIKDTKVLIIDEVSMLPGAALASVDKILKAFNQNEEPFGGIQVILTGDFFQLPPITRNSDTKDFAWKNPVWVNLDLNICYLTEQFRQKESDDLNNILNEIRSGEVSEDSMQKFRGRYKKEPESSEIRPTKLYTHNADVDAINRMELDQIDGPTHSFSMTEKGKANLVTTLKKSILANETLELKEGAVVIFIKNNYEKGYLNGTLGRVTSFDGNVPVVEIFSGREIKADKEVWQTTNDGGQVMAEVSQIPLRLAWAITIHKSQGMSLDAAEVDLSKSFESGQGYVALSRLKSLEGLKLMGLNKKALEIDGGVLKVDARFQELSAELEQKYSEDELSSMQNKFIEENGSDEDYTASVHEAVESTYEKTKNLLGESIYEIAKVRGISSDTVLKHLTIIKEQDPDIDMTFYMPEEETFEMVKEVVEDLKADADEDNFSPNGQMKLKPIFDGLDGEVQYDDIKLSLLFIDSNLD